MDASSKRLLNSPTHTPTHTLIGGPSPEDRHLFVMRVCPPFSATGNMSGSFMITMVWQAQSQTYNASTTFLALTSLSTLLGASYVELVNNPNQQLVVLGVVAISSLPRNISIQVCKNSSYSNSNFTNSSSTNSSCLLSPTFSVPPQCGKWGKLSDPLVIRPALLK